jgi:flagellar P-ring protein FlgI
MSEVRARVSIEANAAIRKIVKPRGLCLLLALSLALPFSAFAETPDLGHTVRVKDVAAIEGIRDNQLVGYGLVVGLHGTGDSQQTIFPYQSLVSALERMGITVPQSGAISAANMQVKNMAGVFVVATLPPFTQPGYKLDITVSSAGDARSLEGGILLMTPLYGPDGKIFAQAQGALVLGGYEAAAGGNSHQVNHPTTARIPDGALVERSVSFDLTQLRTIDVVLNDADFHTAEGMAASINRTLSADRARALDSRRVEVVPMPDEDVPALLDKIEQAPVEVYPARVSSSTSALAPWSLAARCGCSRSPSCTAA